MAGISFSSLILLWGMFTASVYDTFRPILPGRRHYQSEKIKPQLLFQRDLGLSLALPLSLPLVFYICPMASNVQVVATFG